jgi:regulator of nucleoside diphosphate kinase
MTGNHMLITELDHRRLSRVLDGLTAPGEGRPAYLDVLRQRLDDAQVVPADQAPRTLVTMNSLVELRNLGRGEKFTCKLAYPAEADPARPSVSVAAPLGTAMLGARVGETIACPVGEAVRCVKVERIFYQPEAAGDFHL